MISAIIYSSRTGHSREYAEMLAEMTGTPAMELGEEKEKITKTDEVVYIGWIRAGDVVGLKKVISRVKVACVLAVGMLPDNGEIAKRVRQKYKMGNTPVLFLPGGYDPLRVRGADRILMKMMRATVERAVEKSSDATDSDRELLRILREGESFVDRDHLLPVLEILDVNIV